MNRRPTTVAASLLYASCSLEVLFLRAFMPKRNRLLCAVLYRPKKSTPSTTTEQRDGKRENGRGFPKAVRKHFGIHSTQQMACLCHKAFMGRYIWKKEITQQLHSDRLSSAFHCRTVADRLLCTLYTRKRPFFKVWKVKRGRLLCAVCR